MTDSEYLDTNEAAALLKRSVSTLRKWRVSGGGPKYMKGDGLYGRVLYTKAEIENFIKKNMRLVSSTAQGKT